MRQRYPREKHFTREIIVDNFAGGGGASTGIEMAIGRSVDIAINHDPAAIAMHRANHPETEHYCESVWDVDPREVAQGRPVGLCWLSPDCTHFSKAKGGKPREKKIRGLAWVALRWAATVRPRVIMLENVEEFTTWGPLVAKCDPETGRMLKIIPGDEDEEDLVVVSEPGEYVPTEQRFMIPDPNQKGRTFRTFVNALRRQGYQVDWRELRACDYGAPTIRKRFFLVARCDGRPIVWPEPTHGDPKSAAVKSGKLKPWRTAAEIIDWSLPCPSIFERKKPLAKNTLRRIARGLQKFVIENPKPFIAPEAEEPLGTITAGGMGKSQLVAAFLSSYYGETSPGEARGSRLDEPAHTVTAGGNRFALVTSHLVKMRGTNIGQPFAEPLQTITAGGNHFGEVRAFLMAYYGTGVGQTLDEPLHTVVTKDRFGLVTVHGREYQIVDIGMRMLEPHELFAAQGFPDTYIIDRDADGKSYPKSAQVARCGNSVPPPFAEALVRANLPEHCTGTGKAAAFERYKQPIGQMALTV